MTIVDTMTRVSRRLLEEVVSQGRVGLADGLVTAQYVEHGPFARERLGIGPEAVRASVRLHRAAFPDATFAIEAVIAGADAVVLRWRARGTHRGPLAGIAPTHRAIEITGITIHRFEGDRIAEAWTCWDALGILRQLGMDGRPGGPSVRVA